MSSLICKFLIVYNIQEKLPESGELLVGTKIKVPVREKRKSSKVRAETGVRFLIYMCQITAI